MTRDVHAPRRTPTRPTGPLDLRAAADALLVQARSLEAQRSARTLTPGAGAPVKQTLLALVAGQRLHDHPAPGPATLQTITGTVLVHTDDTTDELPAGAWASCPSGPHALEAVTDTVVLLTVGPVD